MSGTGVGPLTSAKGHEKKHQGAERDLEERTDTRRTEPQSHEGQSVSARKEGTGPPTANPKFHYERTGGGGFWE